ncbi:MAG: DUF948 domain-containing protein [Candidatus Rokuibacteriota bacterium]
MLTMALLVIALCVAVVTAVLVPTLLAVKRAASRAETVLMVLEREVRPMASQLHGLTDELRALSKHADQNVERMGVIIDRVDQVTTRVSRVVGFVGGFTRVGQLVGAATGVKKGLDVFITRLISKNKKH